MASDDKDNNPSFAKMLAAPTGGGVVKRMVSAILFSLEGNCTGICPLSDAA